jgi:Effector-associated domain 11
MVSIEKATEYILGIITENEVVKKFPAEFIQESALWIRSWFLKEDPTSEKILTNPAKSAVAKKAILESKLEDLQTNPQFNQELAAKLKIFEAHKSRILNVIDNSDLEVQGKFHVGNTGNAHHTSNYDEENVIKGSKIKVGGDFRLGNDIVQGNKTEVHHHHHMPVQPANTPTSTTKAALHQLLHENKIGEVIKHLLEKTNKTDSSLYNTISLLSARFHSINSEEQCGTTYKSDENVERNRIRNSLMQVIEQF